ncbi:adenylyl-sulfate kinase [Phycicoccus sp. CSK15P-2]|uniref:adenylyl-sulfate kinase n=1 Tax=Phycicoccus sp. CSK15P-2 TaxID=2807627 RepID=UPI00194E717B|nr:adenylyl-sulfate kinase [Phycicoccus sp. CSK15P-2]MBM6402871.1 adenylyl-sulfate kinase [Phycicoccus sp. CSK15P-2]
MTDAPPVVCPSPEQLDDLDVLRRGLYGPEAAPRPLVVPEAAAEAAVRAGSVTVVDPEGVPVVRLEPVTRTADGRLAGEPIWLSPMSSRPFEDAHLDAPVDLSDADLLVVTAPSDVPATAPDGGTLLVLASTSLDGDSAGNDLVRAASRAASAAQGARMLVVPVPAGDDERRSALLATLRVQPAVPGLTAAAPGPDERHPAGVVVLCTGLSGSGKSTIARDVATRLIEEGTTVTLLDGDRVRRHLTAGLGFSPEDRDTNVRRIGWVAAEVAHHGGIAVCSPIAPKDSVRREVAEMARARGARFVLVHVATPVEECERRDRKGLYAAARRGEIPDFTGVSAPYDVPEAPDARIDTTGRGVRECADEVMTLVRAARTEASGG